MSFSNEIADVEGLKKAFDGLDGSLNKNATDLLKLIKVYEDLNKVTQNTAQTAENLGKAQKATADAAKQKEAIDKNIIATTEKVNKVEKDTIEVMIKKRLTTAESTKEITLQTKAELASIGSKQKLIAETAILENQLNKVNLTTKEGAKEADRLRAQIDKNNVTIKASSSALGAQKINIGNYASALSGLPGPIGEVAGGFEGLLSKVKAFGPWGALVAGGLLALSAPLVAFFTKTEEGMDLMEQKVAGAKAAFAVLTGELIKGGRAMVEMFDDPKDKVSTFYTKIFTFINPALTALGKRMDSASTTAQSVVKEQQKLEDKENAMIVVRAKASDQIKQARLIYAQANLPLNERITALATALDLEGKTADAEIKHQDEVVAQLQIIKDEKLKVGQWLRTDETKLQQAIAKTIELSTDSAGRQIRATNTLKKAKKELIDEGEALNKEEADNRLKAVEIANQIEKGKINKKHIDGISDTKQYQAELIAQEVIFLNAKQALYKPESKEYQDIELQKQAITIKSQDDILKAIQDRFKQQKEIEEQGTKDLRDLLKEQTTAEEKAADDAIKIGEDLIKQKEKLDEDAAKKEIDRKKKIKEAAIDLAFATMNAVFDINANKLSAELSDLEKKKDKELSNKNLTEAQKAAIEASYLKKENAIKTKQAENDKKQALFNIAMNTAVAAVKGLSEGGPLLMAIYIALGLVQAAVVMSKPLPKYAKGTQSAESAGIFGEAGRELMFPVGGGAIMADKATYFDGDKFKGAKIYSNPETERMMSMVSDRNIISRPQHDDRLLNKMDELKKAIIQKPIAIYDKDHRMIGQGNSQYQEIYMNRLINRN